MAKPIPEPCRTCGYPLEAELAGACGQCEGTAVAVDGVTETQPGARFFLIDLIDGFTSLFHASLLLMTKKEFIGKLTLAIAVNLILVLLFFVGIAWGFWEMIGAIDWWFGWMETTAQWLSFPLAILAAWFLAPTLISAGMTPFLDPIANATEMMLAGEKMKPVEMGLWNGMMAGINAAAQVLVLQVFVLLPTLVLSLIPVIGLFFFVFGILFSAYLNALVWLEIPVLRRGYGWKYRRQVVKKNWARAVGFGLAFNLGLLVPFFNILFIGPATAVAASALYFRFDKMTPGVERLPAATAGPGTEPANSAE